ncbi:MAG: lytic murein transglycosylase [Xanthobacteraceae bacterium]|nr:lytic murein transglycosylase [Xanthobacteraceae bacterium]
MKRINLRCLCAAPVVAAVLLTGSAAIAADCRDNGPFEPWLERFKAEAIKQGISRNAIAAAGPYLVYDPRIVNIDHGQRIFAQSFLDFSGKMLPAYRLQQGAAQIKKYQPVFDRAEKQYGVPAAVITAFWGLESDFGSNQGKDNSIKSLTTLAYDCRRADMFRGHLFDALRLIERGDLQPADMLGSWAGELGQTQMMPSEYIKWAVDYDGDGKRNLIRSVPDVIGSTANYLVSLGWKRGEPWLEEVRVPAKMPWDQADLTIQHPRSQWATWGVTRPDGRALQNDGLAASLLLPMGRFGPAFLAYDNFQAYLKWNASLTYSTTAAYYATRLAGAPAMQKGSGPLAAFTMEQTKELQQYLIRAGHDVGGADGRLGTSTRNAVRAMQIKLGLPADSYPTVELLDRLRAGH